jgi:NAD(P)-dependent dehydrogenase (short-subunit alcohol dehydrogenase family)
LAVHSDTGKGLRVLVAAGASGIGRLIAESFAKTGARLHIPDEALGVVAKAHLDWGVTQYDVSDEFGQMHCCPVLLRGLASRKSVSDWAEALGVPYAGMEEEYINKNDI